MLLHGLAGDLKLGVRRLAATPSFLIFASLSLAIGIGVTTAVYSILYSLVWRPIAIADPSTAVFICAPGGGKPLMRALFSESDFTDLRDAQRTMSAVAASRPFGQPLAAPASTEFIEGEAVSGEYFRVAGISASRGRVIAPEDDAAAAPVILISDRTWRTRFDADPQVVGQVVRLGGQPFEIIGIAPPAFEGVQPAPGRTAAWIPMSTAGRLAGAAQAARVTALGRLAPGRTVTDAASEVGAIGQRLDESRPRRLSDYGRAGTPSYVSRRGWSARAADDTGQTSESRVAALVVLIVALVLGVACTNLANLMLARGALRQQEFAIRRALGASRWRLIRELCVEGGLVAVSGGVCAVLLLRALLQVATVDVPLPHGIFTIAPELNVPALLVASAAMILSLVVFGLEPALQLTRRNVTADFGGGTAAVGIPRSRRQRGFIRWQVAVSTTFFLVAAILIRVIAVEVSHDTGVDVDRLGIATLHFAAHGWDEARARRTLDVAAAQLKAAPGIEAVAVSTGVPFGMNMTPMATVTTPDKPIVEGSRYDAAYTIAATPEIFRTLGVPILRGRAFDARDDQTAPRVVVASERTARKFFGTADAVGRQLVLRVWSRPGQTRDALGLPRNAANLVHSNDETYTIVGIARDTDTGEAVSRKDNVIYMPLAQHFEENIAILARTSGDPWDAARAIQAAVRRADPDLGTGTAGPASLIMAGEFFAARVAASFASALGLATLLMAMVGLYGIQSHIVARRTREVGVRMAIGASAAQIKRMILGEGYRPVLQGLALGLLFGALARVVLRATLSATIQTVDPLAFVLVPIPLMVAAFVACYVPARRASRVDPNEALRHL